MAYQKPSRLRYRLVQAVSYAAATVLFRRKILRNEIKNVQGPYVVIANHQAALDFVNIIGATHRFLSFVISQSFYSTLPFKKYMDKMGVIPKQQFQTSVRDLRRIRSVIEQGEPVVIYPAGLMCEDGLSTPIPSATYKFLKWLDVDVYMARATGTYFVMPKWTGGLRPGRTYMDIYKLFSKEELASMDEEAVRQRTDKALLYDAYRDQERHRIRYHKNHVLHGLENVLYACPHCGVEFSIQVRDNSTLYCTACGYEQTGDAYGFLHNHKGLGPELRYVSDWSLHIQNALTEKICQGADTTLESPVTVQMVDPNKNKFVEVGAGTLRLEADRFTFTGTLREKPTELMIPIGQIPTLPFSPGKHLELQHGSDIYRCLPQDGRLVMKFIHMVKIFYQLRHAPATAEN